MKEINDSVFGQMTYDVSWEKTEKRHILGRHIDLRIVAVAGEEEDILDIQREAYQKYMENEERYIEEIQQAVLDYYLDIYEEILETCEVPRKYKKRHISTNNILEMIRVTTLIFDRDGSFGYLCDCAWDMDNGLEIILSEDKIRVTGSDELI